MPKLLGESVNLGVGLETTRGTGITPSVFIPARTPTGVKPVIEKTLIRETRGTGSMSTGSEIVQKRAEGDLEFNVRSESVGYILKSLLGLVSSAEKSSPNTGVYDHTFSVLTDNPQNPSLTLALSQPNHQDYEYQNAVVGSLEIATPVNELVQATASFIAKDESEHADYTVSFADTDKYFRAYDVAIKIADDISGLDSVQALCLKEFSMSINNNSRPEQCIGSETAGDVLSLLMEIGGSFTLDYKDDTYHDVFTGGNYKAMRLELIRSDETIGDSANPALKIDLPKISFEGYDPDRPLDDVVKEQIDFQAHYDAGEAKLIEATLTNEVTSY